MATVHFIQQGKGGVGKSMIASILYQVLRHLERDVIAYDTDPVNATLAGYTEFNVERLEILRDDNIDPRKFDTLIEKIFELPEDAHVVIDNGASSFVALGSYIKENDIIKLLKENGHKIYFHTVITGGAAVTDTARGLKVLCTNFPDVPIVVWLNYFFGAIELNGSPFHEFKVYKDHKHQFNAIVNIPQGNAATLGKDSWSPYVGQFGSKNKMEPLFC